MGVEAPFTYVPKEFTGHTVPRAYSVGESKIAPELPYKREIVGSKAFNLEYFDYTCEKEMYDDIVSYLGEYRFQLQKYDYEMVYSRGEEGVFALRDTVRGESLRKKSRRVLSERILRGDPIHREQQEDSSIVRLDDQLRFAKTGDKLRWVSPPGPESEGYGRYGYFYEGRIEKDVDGSAKLSMSAIRVEGADLGEYSRAFTQITGTAVNYQDADLFLGDGRVVGGQFAQKDIQEVLKEHFSFGLDVQQAKDFRIIISRIEPHIFQVIDKIKHGSAQEKVRAFNALENYFLKHKKMLEEERESEGKVIYLESRRSLSFDAFMANYGHEPPKAAGSCGSTEKSNSLTTSGGKEADMFLSNEKYDFDKIGECRACGKENIAVGPCSVCRPCDIKLRKQKEAGLAA